MIKVKEIRGLADAILSLKFSKRTYTEEIDQQIRALVHECTDMNGFVEPNADPMKCHQLLIEMNKLAKWGAGVNQSAAIDAGHETILRFIDVTFVISDVSYGTMADLDSHAMRMNNRIVRSSSRLAQYDVGELSEWYSTNIIPFTEVLESHNELPDVITSNEKKFYRTPYGYIEETVEVSDLDVRRGLYPIAIPMSAICKVNLFDLRHIYMRRNKYTNATPELKNNIEDLADQIEKALPGNLGKLVRYDYCTDGRMHHIMHIHKYYVGRDD